ncbi:superoxide dismutase [Fe], putative [Plasmodium chabaudi chabaudi]|uniref:Superoxide dismutase [Fe] n=1 Tax=Plasmodium chabaudi chabaudi TaxID=31271 RepID=A0A1C6YK02_PLACU|nr:superoxide dismutase [Fe], putative [Plasmodium chabaudi chabaudi]
MPFFTFLLVFFCITCVGKRECIKGVPNLKSSIKLNYLIFKGISLSKSRAIHTNLTKTNDSLYETWGVTPLWNAKPFSLMKLPFNPQEMKPFLSEEAIKYHYSKHHAAYVKNLNDLATKHPELKNMSLEEIMKKYDGPIYNNAAQIFNHNFFWLSLKNNGEGKPYGEIKNKIEESFVSFENFKEQFAKEAAGHFGSGWIWLVIKDNKLNIYQGHDAECPIKNQVGHPILALDVWEHAYYVDYKNSRADYIREWFSKINWDFANYNLSIVN